MKGTLENGFGHLAKTLDTTVGAIASYVGDD